MEKELTAKDTQNEDSQDTEYWEDYFEEIYENQIEDYIRGDL